jgi:fatty-acyl-CoA synthase
MPEGWTLPGILESAARTRTGVCYVGEDGRETFEAYESLYARAGAIARQLSDRGFTRSQRVGLIIPETEGFIATLFGASMAGLTVVPLAPPMHLGQLDTALDNWRRLAKVAQLDAVVTTSRIRPILGSLQAGAPAMRAVLAWEDFSREGGRFVADVAPHDMALIQFTSGSTSRPKGVVVTHENLGANVGAITGPDGLGLHEGDVGVSWLPLFHDMGLIGVVMGCVNGCITMVMIPPLVFLKRPACWLRAFTRHRGSLSFAPNFSYDLCVKRVTPDEQAELDLSCWRVAGCGAEPVRAESLRQFAARFASAGFRESSFLPSYGLAEHTLAASFHTPGESWRTDRVSTTALREEHVAIPCPADEPGSIDIVSCGRPFPGHAIRIADHGGHALPERRVGEILLAGPSVMQGYYHEPDLTRAALRGGWLHTGDLGYLANGELYVCGRLKDLIIVHGRNYYPQDLEWVAGDVAGVRKGSVAAFGVEGADGVEQVVLVVESKGTLEEAVLAAEIRHRIQEATGLHVHEVVIVPRGCVAKTTSGKIQRARTKALYLSGNAARVQRPSRTFLQHLLSSRWGYAKVAARRVATAMMGGANGRTGG